MIYKPNWISTWEKRISKVSLKCAKQYSYLSSPVVSNSYYFSYENGWKRFHWPCSRKQWWGEVAKDVKNVSEYFLGFSTGQHITEILHEAVWYHGNKIFRARHTHPWSTWIWADVKLLTFVESDNNNKFLVRLFWGGNKLT